MAENLEKDLEIKSQIMTKLQKTLDQRIEDFGRLERSLAETRKINDDLHATLEEKASAFKQLEVQLQAAQNEILQQKVEIDSMKNLLSYKIGMIFGNRFGQVPGVTLFEKTLSGMFRQNYAELSNSKKQIEAANEASADSDTPSTPDVAPQENHDKLEEEDSESAAETPPCDPPEPKLAAEGKAELVSKLQQRLSSIQFTHGESPVLTPSQLEMCIDLKSNMLDEWELACLCSCIVNFDWKENDYTIEIGTNIGQTAIFMANVFKEMKLATKIVSIDPFSLAEDRAYNPKGNYPRYVALAKQHDTNNACIPITAFSQNIHNIFRNGVGLLFVDGSHQYEDVKKDLDYYSRLVRPGGYVFVDDYATKCPLAYPGVYRAFEEWLAAHNNFELSYKDRYFVIVKKIAD